MVIDNSNPLKHPDDWQDFVEEKIYPEPEKKSAMTTETTIIPVGIPFASSIALTIAIKPLISCARRKLNGFLFGRKRWRLRKPSNS